MLIFPKVPGQTFFPNLSKIITFAAAQLVLIPFVRNQGAAAATDGVTVEGLSVPSTAMSAGGVRRLAVCGEISVQQTQWLKSNQYSWAPADLGQNAHVAADANVKDISFENDVGL